MIAAWMLYALLTTTALAIAAIAAEKLCRTYQFPARWVWAAAMLAPLALALTSQPSLPESTVESRAASMLAAEGETRVQPAAPAAVARVFDQVARQPDAGQLDDILLLVWLSVSAMLAIALFASSTRLRRQSRTWGHARMAGLSVLTSERVGPAVFGVLNPMIVAPRWLIDAPEHVRNAVIAHERQHIVAHDSRLAAAALWLVILAPWNAPLWWMLRRLRAAIEVDCDARVLRGGCTAPQYGAALLEVAERRMSNPILSSAMHDFSCDLERRLVLLFPASRRTSAHWALATGLCAIALTTVAAQLDPPAIAPAQRESGTQQRVTPRSADLGRELVDAAMAGDLNASAALLADGADANRIVRGDGTPLIIAARKGDEELVQLLLRHGAEPDVGVVGDGNPLIMAAAHGHDAIVETLLRHGANVNAIVIGDETPLINAARGGHLPIVRTLVEHGADVSLTVPESRSPFAGMRSAESEARKYGRGDVLEYLRARAASGQGATL